MSATNIIIPASSPSLTASAAGIPDSTVTAALNTAANNAGTSSIAATGITSSVSTLLANVDAYQNNPAAIQQSVLGVLSSVTNGTMNIVDPTTPFIFCLEAASVLTAGFLQANAANTRRQYAYAAQTVEDLYIHMSDLDYLNRFAVPATAKFNLLLPLAPLENSLVTDPDTGIQMIVIPRNSYITIANVTFSIQYPIQIQKMLHGGWNVVYDATIKSPLQPLSTNQIPIEFLTNNDGSEWIQITFDTQQFDIISQTGTLNAAQDFTVSIPFTDQFYFCRVYVENTTTGIYTEIATTHTDQIYDPASPTAVLQVNAQSISVTIPQIYTSTSLLNMGVRIDVYETKGVLNMLLAEYNLPQFVATWKAFDDNDYNEFTAPLDTLTRLIPYSQQIVNGGGNALPFTTLRQQVITNAVGAPDLPITPAQIQAGIKIAGYSIVQNVDNITNRIYIATRPMPSPINQKLLTAANASIETIMVTPAAIASNTSVIDNTTSITLTPDIVYQNVNGIVSIVPSSQLATILAQSPAQRAVTINSGNYLYTPFHYVLDYAENEFAMRPYYLDNPSIASKLFVTENDATLIQVGTQAYSIIRSSTGYQIKVVTQSTTAWQSLPDNQCFCQLSFIPEGETALAFLNGVQTETTDTGERVYTFDLSTNFYLDVNDNIGLTKFTMFTNQPITLYAGLETTFNVVYATSAGMGSQWKLGTVDSRLGSYLLPTNTVGIEQEQLNVVFGYALSTLWAQARSLVTSQQYQTYSADVPYTYATDVYSHDGLGSYINIVDGAVVLTKTHSAGDPVLDIHGSPTYQHRVGDNVLDPTTGNPIVINARGMQRQVDLMLLEAEYWFANDPISTGYRSDLVQTVVEWLTQDLVALSTRLLENTELFFYPATAIGQVQVDTGNGVTNTIEAGQSFIVNLRVPDTTKNNLVLQANLETATIQVISAALQNATVTIDGIQDLLRAKYGTDVTSVQITGLGGSSNNYQAVTVLTPGCTLSIAKQLVAKSDNSLLVEEAVQFNYISLSSTPS